MRPAPRGAILLAVLAWLAVLTAPAPAQQRSTQERYVTIAARACPSYTAITANRARNNIMESLEDLGVDTPYGTGGRPLLVDAKTEADYQPLCRAIDNWQFTLGTDYQSRAVPGVWGSLSKVTGAFSPTIVTESSVPLLDGRGEPTGTIDGATTIRLTDAQRQLASSANKLWIQGGTPTLPITDPDNYAFGALRCATDNLNGDNVEWISYPPDTIHVFCFAYYVEPAPTSGTITVRKEVELPQGTGAQKIRFSGDISYTPGGEFFLTAGNGSPGRQSFIRAAGRSWSFAEGETPLGTLTAITCTSTGSSTFTTDVGTRSTTVNLAAGDNVTCTYRNRYRRPAGALALRKISLGGVGDFGFRLDNVATGDGIDDAGVTTREAGVAELVEPADAIAALPDGTYDVDETTPPDVGGTWRLESTRCSAADGLRTQNQRTQITVPPAGPGTVCTFTNRFTPAGAITLRKVTLGGTATARFQVRPEFGDVRPEREQLATTTEPGVPAKAQGDELSELPIGRYAIQETVGGDDRWEVASVVCDGVPIPSAGGSFVITLTDGEPARDCTVANRRIKPIDPPLPPEPPEPPGPPVEVGPEGGVAGEDIAAPVADLVVRKVVAPRRVQVGRKLRYLVTVVNRGPDRAEDVTLSEQGRSPRAGRLPITTDDGTCRERPPRFCDFGALDPGERATLRVVVTTRRTGRFINRVAVNSSTAQRSLRNKRARAVAFVLPPRPPRFTG